MAGWVGLTVKNNQIQIRRSTKSPTFSFSLSRPTTLNLPFDAVSSHQCRFSVLHYTLSLFRWMNNCFQTLVRKEKDRKKVRQTCGCSSPSMMTAVAIDIIFDKERTLMRKKNAWKWFKDKCLD
ncbi:hypothetical protein Ddye_000152 [Dipteronia dyeriana]|uniref:Uncharacterized protein n=1 Tax=Dipteronia dyeriana TaxID=168575 RepID=A0AAD9XLP2_9ROSI|nr:hypothetical protein Ddye_000152 [Dipteronia dyeriana]